MPQTQPHISVPQTHSHILQCFKHTATFVVTVPSKHIFERQFLQTHSHILQCFKHTATFVVPQTQPHISVPQTHSHNYLSVPQTQPYLSVPHTHSHTFQCLKHTSFSASNTHLSVPQTHSFQCLKHTAFSASNTHLSVPQTHIFQCLKHTAILFGASKADHLRQRCGDSPSRIAWRGGWTVGGQTL